MIWLAELNFTWFCSTVYHSDFLIWLFIPFNWLSYPETFQLLFHCYCVGWNNNNTLHSCICFYILTELTTWIQKASLYHMESVGLSPVMLTVHDAQWSANMNEQDKEMPSTFIAINRFKKRSRSMPSLKSYFI